MPDAAPPLDQGVLDTNPMDVIPDVVKLDVGTCEYPEHSKDCSQVTYFQCGFSASCSADGKTIEASWHEHVFCGYAAQDGYAPEDIVPYSCSFVCPTGCDPDSYVGWPDDGAQLVQELCNP